MKLTWQNRIAYALLIAAVVYYVVTVPLLLHQLEAERSAEAVSPVYSSLSAFLLWLTGPIYLIGWAAVVEYLSRIAAALQRNREPM